MFIQRIHLYPAAGKEPELRTALEEWTKKRQAQGVMVSLTVQAFSAGGPAFAKTTKFRDLTEMENRRRQDQADPVFQAAVAKFASLSRAPVRSELYEVLVPYKS